MTRAIVPIAEGTEEMEAVIIVDILRRAGWGVTLAGLETGVIKASRGVGIVPDAELYTLEAGDYDVLAIPGGMGGVTRLMGCPEVLRMIHDFVRADKLVGAICAGPLVLQAAGVLEGRTATCHPGVRDRLTVPKTVDEPVVVDGRLVTSQGPGTAMRFALTLVEQADGPAARDRAADGLVLQE